MPAIRLKTEVPGPRSRRLMKRRADAVPRGVYHATPIFAERAEGAVVEDVDGNRFLDFAGGIGCANIGHAAEAVLQRVRGQLRKFIHTCFSVVPYEPYVELAEQLNRLAPGNFPRKTLLVNSGAEAVENAVKIARAYTGRPAVICFEDAFHGRTMMALSLTSKTRPYKAGFAPFMADVYRIPYAYCYRCAFGLEYPSCELTCAHHLEYTFRKYVAPEAVAAIIVEPVLGEGGFMTPPPGYFSQLIEICRRHRILFIADEVQTGMGRTGTLFASEQYGIEPDMLIAAKSLAGGLPLASVTGRSEIMDAPGTGGLGGTFGGNPVSCAAALAVLETLEKHELCARATQLGESFVARARSWQTNWPIIGAIHGLGAMRSLELVRWWEGKQPADVETAQIGRYCYEHGLITIPAGTYGNTIRLLVPLVITDDEFNEGLQVLEDAIEYVSQVPAHP